METISLKSVQAAAERIRGRVHRTPILSSRRLNALAGVDLHFKCENLQKVGAFKARGATNAVLSLTEDEACHGVVTHSSGNHAAALAMAAGLRGVPAYIVMPENAPAPKKAAVQEYGGRIVFCAPTLAARESTAQRLMTETGAAFIHPYNDARVMAGQGTVGLEIIEDLPRVDLVMTPVGGGGLLSGCSVAVKGLRPEVEVWGAEPAAADDAHRSLSSGELMAACPPQSIADGLLTSLGSLSFPLIHKNVSGIALASEESIVRAMRLLWETMKIIVEPSGAVPFAAVLENPAPFAGKRVALVLSGGNVDFDRLPWR